LVKYMMIEQVEPTQENTPAPAESKPRILLKHILAGGIYIKTYYVPRGAKIWTKQFAEDHVSILGKGSVLLEGAEGKVKFVAPAHCNIPAHARIGVIALEDSVWYCIHPTEETDLDLLNEKY
jgi:hypothetical protein